MQGLRVTEPPIPHWPGRYVDLDRGEKVWLAQTPAAVPPAKKETVLCLHGMSGAATNWTDLMGALAPDFDCAAVDLPGSGFSPRPARRSGYTIRALAAVVARLIERLDAGPVHLMGNSMGGDVALRVAAARPDLVRTLTLISAALPDRRPHKQTIHFPVISLPFVGERLVRAYVARFPAENRVAGVYATCLYDASAVAAQRFAADVAELRRRDELGYDPVVLAAAARTLTLETLTPAPFSLWSAARRVSAPSLVLFGSHDRLVSPRLAATAARTFGNARVIVLPQTGHIGQMEHPAAIADLFREMVEATRATGNADRPAPVEA